MNFYNFYKNIIKTLNSALIMIRIQKINHGKTGIRVLEAPTWPCDCTSSTFANPLVKRAWLVRERFRFASDNVYQTCTQNPRF